MSAEVWILVSTAALAVVAVTAAVVAVLAVRQVRSPGPSARSTELVRVEQPPENNPAALTPRVIEGRLIVPPTQQQVIAAALGRPGVRLSVLAHGVAYALRPESRDRILGMMRREYRQRRRERLQAGRRAARAAIPSNSSDNWLGS